MDILTHQVFCNCCNDKRRYESHIYTAQNILNRLGNIANRYDNEEFSSKEKQLLQHLSMDGKHPHFMCGQCLKVDTQDLKNLEQKIDILIVKIAKNVTHDNREYYDTLRLLQGEYSGKYHILERFVRGKDNK